VVVVKFKVVSVNLRSFVICGKSQVFFKFGSFNWIIAKFEFFFGKLWAANIFFQNF
jgi:hypothetical protein